MLIEKYKRVPKKPLFLGNTKMMKDVELDKYLVRLPRAKNSGSDSCPRWVCNSNDVINLKVVQEEDELFTEEGYFHPVFTNQVNLLTFSCVDARKYRYSTIEKKLAATSILTSTFILLQPRLSRI